jgi:hypothetical protein
LPYLLLVSFSFLWFFFLSSHANIFFLLNF